MANIRRDPRLIHNARIMVRDGKGKPIFSQEARMHNIGPSGFGFMGDEELTRGLIYNFEIYLGKKPIRAQGKVVHKRIETDHFTYGIRFMEVPMMSQAQLARFLSSKFKRIRIKAFIISFLILPILLSGFAYYFQVPITISFVATGLVAFLSYLILPY